MQPKVIKDALARIAQARPTQPRRHSCAYCDGFHVYDTEECRRRWREIGEAPSFWDDF